MSSVNGEPARRTLIAGLAGGSASGKTTFIEKLLPLMSSGENPLKVEVYGLDRYFYRGEGGGPMLTLPSTGETMPNNNHPDSADNARLIADVKARAAAADAPDIILIEGLMTLHVESIRNILDLRLFLELDADVRALRRLLRDMNGGRGNTDPRFISTYYLECARIGHAAYVEPSRVYADLIIRGDSDFSRTVPLAAAALRDGLTRLRQSA